MRATSLPFLSQTRVPSETDRSASPRVSGKKSTKRTKSINGPLYVFRGRINTEVMEVENVEDGTGWCNNFPFISDLDNYQPPCPQTPH